MRNTCSTRYCNVLSRTISANGLPARNAVQRHWSARHEKLCSTVRLSDSTIPASVCAMALRMAGPMTGKSASARGRGSRRTEEVLASSTVGASARVSCSSSERSAIASGSTRLTSRVCAAGSWMYSRRSRSSRCSGPTSSVRSSSNESSGPWPVPTVPEPSGARVRPRAAASAIALRLGDRQMELVGQAHRHLGEERRERRAIRLVRAELLGLARERGEHLVHLRAQIVGEPLMLVEHLLAEIAVSLRHLLVERQRPLVLGLRRFLQ